MNQVNQSTTYKSAYRPEIDGLRAFAVLSVVAFHSFPSWLEGGFIGVDVFFVISGFLITSHIFEQLKNGQFSFSDFFSRRVRRIFPALILVTASSLVFGWLVLLADEYSQLGKHIASGAAFITNFILVDESGYFDNAAETKPMLHLWSLAVEEQFYIVWPIALWLAWIRRVNLLTITIIVAILSFNINLYFIKSYPTEIFFWPFGRFWELLSGSVLAWIFVHREVHLTKLKLSIDKFFIRVIHLNNALPDGTYASNIMSFLGLLLLFYGVININENMAFPSKWAFIPVLGSALIIASESKAWLNRVFLMNPVIIWFGLISYPLYLWHWPILSFLQILDGTTPDSYTRLVAVLISILLAWLTYQLIEKPIRFGHNRPRNSYLIASLLILVGLSGLYINQNDGITPYNLELKYIAEAKGDWEYPRGLIKRDYARYTSNLDANILFVGDSHIEQYGPRIVDRYKKNQARESVFITGAGCPLIPGVFRDRFSHCQKLFERLDNILVQNPIETIVIGFCFNCYFSKKKSTKYYFEEDGKKLMMHDELAVENAKKSFYKYVKNLSFKYKVVVLLDSPKDERFDPQNIILSSVNRNRSIPLDSEILTYSFQQKQFQLDLEKELAQNLEEYAVVVTQSDIICPNTLCEALASSGVPKYKDSDHMRPFFVKEKMDVLDQYYFKQTTP